MQLGGDDAWGLGLSLIPRPKGISADLSPGTFGHGGAYGTQVWCDPVKGTLFILMIQRQDIGNSDGSELRKKLQETAAKALAK